MRASRRVAGNDLDGPRRNAWPQTSYPDNINRTSTTANKQVLAFISTLPLIIVS